MTRRITSLAHSIALTAALVVFTAPVLAASRDVGSQEKFNIRTGLSPLVPPVTMLGMSAAAGVIAFVIQRNKRND